MKPLNKLGIKENFLSLNTTQWWKMEYFPPKIGNKVRKAVCSYHICSHMASFRSSDTTSTLLFHDLWTCWTLCLECYSPKDTHSSLILTYFGTNFNFWEAFLNNPVSPYSLTLLYLSSDLFICFPLVEHKLQRKNYSIHCYTSNTWNCDWYMTDNPILTEWINVYPQNEKCL